MPVDYSLATETESETESSTFITETGTEYRIRKTKANAWQQGSYACVSTVLFQFYATTPTGKTILSVFSFFISFIEKHN